MLKKTQGVGPIRKVVLVKDDHEGLGISITVRNQPFFVLFCFSFLKVAFSDLLLMVLFPEWHSSSPAVDKDINEEK